MVRPDLSTKLIHLTKGYSDEDAVSTLLTIVGERRLIGGDGYIKGGQKCVCFCETPISHLAIVLANRAAAGFKYRAFGVMFDKVFIYAKGGRPVIYGEEGQYDDLPDSLKYRHVTFDPTRTPKPADFTWEREWRLRTDELKFTPEDVTVLFPARKFVKIAYEAFTRKMEEELKKGVPDKLPVFPWHFVALEDLGVKIPTDKIEGIDQE